MAISTNTLDSQRVQVAAPGTSVAANPQPFDNTHTIVVYNRGARVITVGIGTAGGAIAVGGGTEVPVGGAITLAIGTNTNRAGGNFDPPGRVLIIDGAAGGGSDCLLTYLNSIGPS